MSLLHDRGISARRFSDFDKKINYFDWNRYTDSFWKIISSASSLEECEESVNSLMDNLLKYHCEDIVLSAKLIDYVAVYRNSRGSENREETVAKDLIACDNAWGKDEIYYQCQARNFLIALRRSDSKLLRVFMKYGIDVLAVDQETETQEIIHVLKGFYYHALGVERILDDRVLDWEEVLIASELMSVEYYRMISRRMDTEDHTRQMQGLFGVEAILRRRRGDGTHHEYAECVRIYFRDTNWPFISSSEMRFMLETFGCEKPLFVESLCRDFDELFPESSGTLHALRSLKDLCRAEMRGILRHQNQKRATLPAAVSSLCIPHTLKDYILGEEW